MTVNAAATAHVSWGACDSGVALRDTERLNEEVLPLVLRARAGDQEALGELAGACLEHVHRWALAQTGDPDLSEPNV